MRASHIVTLFMSLGSFGALCLPTAGQAQDTAALSRTTTERLIIDLAKYDVLNFEAIAFSSDLRRIAIGIEREDNKECVLVDGKEGPAFKKVVGGPFFNADGTRLAYEVVTDERMRRLVVDERPGKPYDMIESLTFSLDGRRIGYTAKRGKQTFVTVDDKEYGPFPNADPVKFSGDSLHFAFIIRDKNRLIPLYGMVDGTQRKDSIPIVFSPVGNRLAYLEGDMTDRQVVVDQLRQTPESCSAVEDVTFSPDGLHLALECKQWLKPAKTTVYLDGKPQASYSSSSFVNLLSSDPVRDLTFSPDGKRLSYRVLNQDGSPMVVVDGKEFKESLGGRVSEVLFSPDGSRVAWSTLDGVMVDGVKHEIPGPRSADRLPVISFSPDSKRMAYSIFYDPGTRATERWGMAMIVDGKEQKRYSWARRAFFQVPGSKSDLEPAGTVLFSPDSKHAAYWTCEGLEKNHEAECFVVIDGTEGPRFQTIRGMVWDSPSSIRYIGLRDDRDKIFEVREVISAAN
jgi:WD40 repeat protein